MRELVERVTVMVEYGQVLKAMMMMLAICSLRLYAAMMVLPATADQAMQGVVRNGVALALGIFIAWGQPMGMVDGISTLTLLAVMLKETLLGLLLGFAAATVFWVAEGVGVLIDNQAGYNNVQQTHPLSGEQSTPVGNLLGQLAICGFYLLGGMLALAALVFESFKWWPLGALAPSWQGLLADFAALYTTGYLQATVKIAAPVVLVLILVDLGFGLIAKTADKLEPSNLAQPIKGAVALAMVGLLVALFFEQVKPMLALGRLAADLSQWLQAGKP
jgi:type III secretion protein T